eukprot:767548-Hanusia_phi.AAC.1
MDRIIRLLGVLFLVSAKDKLHGGMASAAVCRYQQQCIRNDKETKVIKAKGGKRKRTSTNMQSQRQLNIENRNALEQQYLDDQPVRRGIAKLRGSRREQEARRGADESHTRYDGRRRRGGGGGGQDGDRAAGKRAWDEDATGGWTRKGCKRGHNTGGVVSSNVSMGCAWTGSFYRRMD